MGGKDRREFLGPVAQGATEASSAQDRTFLRPCRGAELISAGLPGAALRLPPANLLRPTGPTRANEAIPARNERARLLWSVRLRPRADYPKGISPKRV